MALNAKIFFFLFFFSFALLLAANAAALSASLDKTVFLKGEMLEISGTAKGTLKITALSNNKNLVFSEKVPLDENNNFAFSQEISFSDPKGSWTLALADSNESISREITVNPVRESEFFAISFLSPASTAFKRLERLELSVKITDAGRPVNGAWVEYWDMSGKRQRLKTTGDGMYGEFIELPIDTELKDRVIPITAFRQIGGKKYGGETSLKLKILPAAISLDVLEPRVNEYVIGKPITLKLLAKYDSGEPLLNQKLAKVFIDNQEKDLNVIGNGLFFFSFDPLAGKKEAKQVELKVTVEDSFGNTASKKLSFRPIGELFWFIKSNALGYLIPILFFVYIIFLSAREALLHLKINSMRKRKKMLVELKKKLQQDYFVENIISKDDYGKSEQKYDAELNDLELKLKSLEQKKELI